MLTASIMIKHLSKLEQKIYELPKDVYMISDKYSVNVSKIRKLCISKKIVITSSGKMITRFEHIQEIINILEENGFKIDKKILQ